MPQLRIIKNFGRMTDITLVARVRFIVSQMTNNSNFLSPTPSLESITLLNDRFEKAAFDAEDGGSYDRLLRDDLKAQLVTAMCNLGDWVLYISKNNRLVAESSGFKLVGSRSPRPPVDKAQGLRLLDGQNKGELLLLFKKVQSAMNYIYQITADADPANAQWQNHYGTLRKYLFQGLESGKKYWVRVVAIGIKNQVVYSDAVCRIVQ